MFVLNYLYFLILTMLLCQHLNRRRKTVERPLGGKGKLVFDGPELFWTLMFSTGLLAFSAPAGLDLMAIRLFSLEILCLACLYASKNKAVWTTPMGVYALFLLWLAIGLLYSPSAAYGVRVILKYVYPLLVILVASSVVRDGEVFLKSSLGARWVALGALIIGFAPVVETILFPGVFWYATARAVNFISMSMLSLALFFYMGRRRKDLFLALLFCLPCLAWVFRTSIMGSLVGLMVFSLFRYKIRALPVIALLIITGIGAVFFIPVVKEKMFGGKEVTLEQFMEGKVNMDDVESNARFAMWEYFEKHFYQGREWLGSGTGACQHHFYNTFLFGGLKVMHSDIVQMKCDNGRVAVALYYFAILLMVLHAFAVFTGRHGAYARVCAITAGSSLAGVAVTMYSDNVVNYSMCTLAYPFGFYGMMLGLLKGERRLRK